MSPNPLHLFAPHLWFSRRRDRRTATSKYCHRDTPVPGLYHYIPGRGNYLVVRDDDPRNPLNPPVPVVYSCILDRYLFKEDFASRKVFGHYEKIVTTSAKPSRNSSFGNLDTAEAAPPQPQLQKKKIVCGAFFFRLDDKSYIKAYDETGVYLNPSFADRYKMVYTGEEHEIPRFRKVRLIPGQSSVHDGKHLLSPVTEAPSMATTRPPSPRSSWDTPTGPGGLSSKSPSGGDSKMEMIRAQSFPDISGLHTDPSKSPILEPSPAKKLAEEERVETVPAVGDTTQTDPTTAGSAPITVPGPPSGRATAAAPSSKYTPNDSPVDGARTASSPPSNPAAATCQCGISPATGTGVMTPMSPKGQRTPSKKGMSIPNVGELRRKLEALTSRKRSEAAAVSPVSS